MAHPPTPLPLRIASRLGDVPGVRRWLHAPFDPDALCATARRRTGLSDFGPGDYVEGLRQICHSADNDAELHPLGRLTLQNRLVQVLCTRLYWARARAAGNLPAPARPLFVLGLPRSGTTLLHRLLSLAPGARALKLWELVRPLSPWSPARRRRATMIELGLFKRLAPGVDAKHFMTADTPEECWPLLLPSLCTHGFWVLAPLPGYIDWVSRQDPTPTYRMYREMLGLMTREAPHRRLVLKFPGHLRSIRAIAETFPDAGIVQTHRDPTKVVGSMCSLMRTGHGPTSAMSETRHAALEFDRLARIGDRVWPDRAAIAPGRVLDVHYADLVDDPVGVVRRIHRHFDHPFDDAYAARLRAWLANRPKNKYGRHVYDLASVGLDPERVRARFADYESQVPPRRS